MDLKMQTDLSIIPSVIEFNFEELKNEIESNLVKYKNLVVTEDSVRQAKSDKADLNKFITALEDSRKEVKRRCLEPYNSFETKCKELVCLVKTPVAAIDSQIKEIENIKKQQKYDELKSCFDNYIGDMADIIDFDKILNPKWGNTTLKTDVLKAEIEDNIDRIRQELETLNKEYADKPYKAAVISAYCKEYSTSQALVCAAQLQREEEIQKKVLEQKNPETVKTEINPIVVESVNENIVNEVDDPIIGGGFIIENERSKVKLLKKYMTEIGINVIGTMSLKEYEDFKKYKEEI